MKTYEAIEKNGSGVLIVSADDEKEARTYLNNTLKDSSGWCIEVVDDNEEVS